MTKFPDFLPCCQNYFHFGTRLGRL